MIFKLDCYLELLHDYNIFMYFMYCMYFIYFGIDYSVKKII